MPSVAPTPPESVADKELILEDSLGGRLLFAVPKSE